MYICKCIHVYIYIYEHTNFRYLHKYTQIYEYSYRRILLAGVILTYTISVISSIDVNILKSDLDSAVLSGSFASSLSKNSGIDSLVVQGIWYLIT
jgi:hypothetical protein